MRVVRSGTRWKRKRRGRARAWLRDAPRRSSVAGVDASRLPGRARARGRSSRRDRVERTRRVSCGGPNGPRRLTPNEHPACQSFGGANRPHFADESTCGRSVAVCAAFAPHVRTSLVRDRSRIESLAAQVKYSTAEATEQRQALAKVISLVTQRAAKEASQARDRAQGVSGIGSSGSRRFSGTRS
jgi:hypothetical protein